MGLQRVRYNWVTEQQHFPIATLHLIPRYHKWLIWGGTGVRRHIYMFLALLTKSLQQTHDKPKFPNYRNEVYLILAHAWLKGALPRGWRTFFLRLYFLETFWGHCKIKRDHRDFLYASCPAHAWLLLLTSSIRVIHLLPLMNLHWHIIILKVCSLQYRLLLVLYMPWVREMSNDSYPWL